MKAGSTAESEIRSKGARWLDGGIIVCLFLFALLATHSIAATQTAWLVGMLLWVARFAFYPPPKIYRTPIDYALLGFFILTGLAAFLSYEPMVSIGKLRGASLFTIVYLFAENIPSRRVVRSLALTLLASCMINVLYTMGERVIGRGAKVQGVSAESPLSAATIVRNRKAYPLAIISGDTVLEVDGQRVHSAEELAASLDFTHGSAPAHVKIYRTEWIPTLEVPRGRLLPGTSAEQRLGISGWTRGRDWRASGFYGHYVTYAEVLQLVAALAVGLFVSLPFKRSWSGGLLMMAIAGLGLALLLTVTRASWLAFLISTGVILLVGASRRAIITVGLLTVPIVLAGLFVLHQKRNVGFFDKQDGSISWRETVWHEGFALLVSKPRHLLVGVGMDSIKAHWREWGLFDQGRLPIGHMHSNLLQIALERGLPTLIAWFLMLGIYIRVLWRLNGELGKNHMNQRDAKEELGKMEWPSLACEWIDRGIVLGALGGTLGFFASGLVHYNWGDSEVVMIFYFIMGLTLALHKQAKS